MNNKEYTERNLGLIFDFRKQVTIDATLLEKIPDGALIEFIDKDYATHESAKSIQPDRFIKLKNRFEPID